VWAWEPNPDLTSNLRESVRLNGLDEVVEVVQAAATDRPGACHLHLPTRAFRNTLNASILAGAPGARIVPVAGRPLDDACAGRSVEFVKIDVEGAEILVWEGMREIRHQNRGLTILLEFNAARYPDPAAFVSRIVADGFILRHVDYDGTIRPVTAVELLDPAHGDWMLWLMRKSA
jgi:FkbM family methyltransferase